jgi:uncharacterized protein (DUF2141 family)
MERLVNLSRTLRRIGLGGLGGLLVLSTHAAFAQAPAPQATAAAPAASAAPASAAACERFAEVQHVRPGQGFVMVAIYTEEASFMRRPAVALRLEAQGETLRVPLCAASGEAVALMVFQDLNANGRMDSNPLGIPIEPYGSSGQAPGFGPPNWAAAKVAMPAAGAAPVIVKLSQ